MYKVYWEGVASTNVVFFGANIYVYKVYIYPSLLLTLARIFPSDLKSGCRSGRALPICHVVLQATGSSYNINNKNDNKKRASCDLESPRSWPFLKDDDDDDGGD